MALFGPAQHRCSDHPRAATVPVDRWSEDDREERCAMSPQWKPQIQTEQDPVQRPAHQVTVRPSRIDASLTVDPYLPGVSPARPQRPLTPQSIRVLQQTIGNRAVQRLLVRQNQGAVPVSTPYATTAPLPTPNNVPQQPPEHGTTAV